MAKAPSSRLLQVGVQSYLLWEQAGRPNGADFSQDARRKLEKQLRAGLWYSAAYATSRQSLEDC